MRQMVGQGEVDASCERVWPEMKRRLKSRATAVIKTVRDAGN